MSSQDPAIIEDGQSSEKSGDQGSSGGTVATAPTPEGEWNVESVQKWRYNRHLGRVEYYIKWEDYPEEENTWEPLEHLDSCPDLVKDFENKLVNNEKLYYFFHDKTQLNGFERNAKCLGIFGADKEGDEIQVLLHFDDYPSMEKLSIKEFYKIRPQECMLFFESRLCFNTGFND